MRRLASSLKEEKSGWVKEITLVVSVGPVARGRWRTRPKSDLLPAVSSSSSGPGSPAAVIQSVVLSYYHAFGPGNNVSGEMDNIYPFSLSL